MTNLVVKSVVERIGIGSKFYTDALVQLNLISRNPEDADVLLNGSLESIVVVDKETGREVEFEVASSEIESLILVSNPSEEEMYIDLLNGNEHEIVLVSSPIPIEAKVLFTFDAYTLMECGMDKTYYLSNNTTNNTYEILLETCFSLMSRYLNEDEHYILLSDLTSLEDRAVGR